jgi:hypothetical protein
MDKPTLHNILFNLMIKYNYLSVRDINKFLGTRKGTALLKHQIERFETSEYIQFISKFIYENL